MIKKVLSAVMCAAIIFTSMSAFAIKEIASNEALLEDSFDSYEAGNAVTSIKGNNGSSASTASDIAAAADASKGKVAEIKSGAKLGAVFNGGKAMSSGKMVLEFDGNLVAGNLWFSLLYSGSLGTRAKWFAGSDLNGLCTITKNATTPGSSVDGYQKFKDSDDNDISFIPNGWAHYKFEVDIDNGSVTAYMDDKVSNTVTGYTYIKNNTIAGIGIYNASQGSRYIDNLKIYKDNGYITYFNEDDMESYDADSNIGGKYVNNGTFKACLKGEALCQNATTHTVETKTPSDPQNIVAAIGNGTQVRYNLPSAASDGIICVSLDMLTGNGGFGIGIRQQGDASLNAKCPMWVYRNAVRTVYFKPGETSYSTSDTSRNYYDSATMYERYQWFNTKLYINAKTGDCWMDINGNISNVKNLDYIGTDNITANTKNNPITAIVLYNSRSTSVNDQLSYIDNFSISVSSDGRSVGAITNGIKKIKLGFKDAIDTSTLDASKFSVSGVGEKITVTKAALDSTDSKNKNVIVEFDKALSVGGTYTVEISDEIKYTDGNSVIKGKYNVTISKSEFDAALEIVNAAYNAGEKASAKCTITTTELEGKSIELIIAAYKDGQLVSAKSQTVEISSDLYGEKIFDIDCTLSENADKIQAFVWSDEQFPYTEKAYANIGE